ncbi:MAG: DMT family transporter [Anaerolineales bacterium]
MRQPGPTSAPKGNDRSKARIPPVLALGLGIFAASTSSILVRFAQIDAPSLVIAAYRLTLASLILAPFLFRQREKLREVSTSEYKLAFLSGLFLALHFGTWITSLEYTSVTSSVVLVQTTPLFVAALSPLLLGERPSWRTLIGLGLAFCGGMMIAFSDFCAFSEGFLCAATASGNGTNVLLGDLLALLGGATGAAYLIIGRRLRADLSLLTYIGLVYSSAAIFLIIAVISFGYDLFGYAPITYLWFLLLAIIPQLMAHSTYNWALRYLPATKVSITLLGEPISAAILAFLVLGELPSPLRIAGAAIVLFGVASALFRNDSRDKAAD